MQSMEGHLNQIVLLVPDEKMLDVALSVGQIEGVQMIPGRAIIINEATDNLTQLELDSIDNYLDEAENAGRIIGGMDEPEPNRDN